MTDVLRFRSLPGAAACFLLILTALADTTAQPLISQPLINKTMDVGELGVGADYDKCGIPGASELKAEREILGDGWGYGYSNLLEDLEVWKQSPYVSVLSIGQSVQGREIWELTINSGEPVPHARSTITIHARTHPHETQSWWVCQQIINILLSEDPMARTLREYCTFHIIPMYNPDGVELETTRYNANGVDLEREWDKPFPQPEAAALRRRFEGLMNSVAPIRVALNLHSSSDPERYFWFHDHTGTSETYADLQRSYIADVRSSFGMIFPWDYRVSWIDQTPTHFPESWFWFNHGTDVLALTYEDVFSHNLSTPDAHFDSAAFGMLNGIFDFLGLGVSGVAGTSDKADGLSLSVRRGTSWQIGFTLPIASETTLAVYNTLGEAVTIIASERISAGTHSRVWEPGDLPAGMYLVRLTTSTGSQTRTVRLVR